MIDAAEGERSGSDWTPEENDLVVASYFAMLAEELAGRDYVKAHHRRALVEQLARRSKAAVEFKHRNISAVLAKLGLPRIKGYLPAWNAQFGGLSLAIERVLDRDRSLLFHAPVLLSPLVDGDPFVPPPIMQVREDGRLEPVKRLVRKFDPVARDARNRSLGRRGAAFVVELEERRLNAAGRSDLMRHIRWVADFDGDGAGYDVHSFDVATGAAKLIEVKTTFGDEVTPFFLSRNELSMAIERPDAFRLYRVFDFSARPRLFELTPPLDAAVRLKPNA